MRVCDVKDLQISRGQMFHRNIVPCLSLFLFELLLGNGNLPDFVPPFEVSVVGPDDKATS